MMQENRKTIVYTGNFCIEHMNAAGKRVFNNAKLLKSLGYHVVLLGVDVEDVSNTSLEESKFVKDGVEIYAYSSSIFKKTRYKYKLFFEEFKRLLGMLSDVCAVICYGSPSLAFLNYKILKFAKKQHIAFISDVVDWLSVASGSVVFKFVKYLDEMFLKAFLIKKSDGIIAVSSWFKQYYREINNCIVIPPLSEKEESFENENEISQIAYGGIPFRMGRKVRNKCNMKDRFDYIIHVLANSKKKGAIFKFHVIGFTRNDLLRCLPNLKRDIDVLGENVVFYGKLSMEETQSIVKKMDYTILLRENNRSSNAGFSTKIVESVSLGVPVITTMTSDLKKYLPEGHGAFYLDLYDLEKSSEKVKLLLNRSVADRKNDKHKCILNKSFDIFSFGNVLSEFIEGCINVSSRNILK